MKFILMVGFSGILGTGYVEDWKMIIGKLMDGKKLWVGLGELVKMIRDAGSKFNDYSVSPKTKQILLHWSCKLTEEDFFNELTN